MKLYTEEEVIELMYWISPIYMDREDIKIFLKNKSTPIELPSDEDMANASNHCKDGQVKVGFLRGVLWLKEQILNQNK
jgi:hypothetical protein